MLFFFLQIVQRRIDLLAAEGIKFINNAEVGKNVDAQQILLDNDAVLLAVGSTCPRNIPLPGNFFLHFKVQFSKFGQVCDAYSGVKKVPSGHPGRLDFLAEQLTFKIHWHNGQASHLLTKSLTKAT